MKIAQIGCTARPQTGGMGRSLFNHARALSEADHDVTVYTLPPLPSEIPPLSMGGLGGVSKKTNRKSEIGNLKLSIHPIKATLHAGLAAWGAQFDPPLDQYDLVHLHLPFFGVADTIAAYKKHHPKMRLVATYHMDSVGTGMKQKYFQWWYKHRFKKVIDACDDVAVTSRAYARESRLERAGVDIEKCEEILLRVDTERFRINTSTHQHINIPYFLFVGALDRAHYFKGLSVLLRALADTQDVQLVVVGDGDLRDLYENQTQQLGITDRVRFTGRVPDEQLVSYYQNARALALPSTDRSEAFGLVLIEAMACGTPVIASDLPGVQTVVKRVDGGQLVPPGKQEELAQALRKVSVAPFPPEDRAALSRRAADTYGLDTLADQLARWYNGVR